MENRTTMKNRFRYKILVIDNEVSKNYSIECPATKTAIKTTVFGSIDAALNDMGISQEYLDRSIADLSHDPKHSYDIVLLDFEMDENKLEINHDILNVICHENDQSKREQLLSQLIKTEYPLGALTLLPLYKLAFDPSRRGSCIVQSYSKVIWTRCPKAAAVFVLINNIGNKGTKTTIEPNNVSGVPIEELINRRATSILQQLPADYLYEFHILLLLEDDDFWNRPLELTAIWLNCDMLNFGDIRPDIPKLKILEAKSWLRSVLSGRSYVREAMNCWHNPIVDQIAHQLNLANEKHFLPIYQVSAWARPDGIIAIGNDTYRVCKELFDDLNEFLPLKEYLSKAQERKDKMHQIFRLALSNNNNQGYIFEDVINYFSSVTNLKIKMTGDAWGKNNYLWMHKKVLINLIDGLIKVPRLIDGKVEIHCNADKDKSAIYIIAYQEYDITRDDAEKIYNRAKNGEWGPFPILNDWGRMELWGANGLWQLTSFEIKNITDNDTLIDNTKKYAIVMVLPLEIDGGF